MDEKIRIAFFVEGQTERIFVEKFLYEYIGFDNFELEILCYKGQAVIKNPGARFYIVIHDVGGDGNLFNTIEEQAEKMLKDSDYSYIIGLRDLYNPKHPDLHSRKQEIRDELIKLFYKRFDKCDYKHTIKLVIAVMEIEAWFLLDKGCFDRITKKPEEVSKILDKENTEEYDHPAKVVDKIYWLSGNAYGKHEDDSYRITHNLDYNFLCSDATKARSDSWHCFVECVDNCFA
ncbi:MAG: DUF4276 family protein [Nitrospirae bacterium]|nr:DUF4276 family protein [Nitrospirota bacterium]